MIDLKATLERREPDVEESGVNFLLAPIYVNSPIAFADIDRVFSTMGDVVIPKRRSLTS